MGMGNSFMKMVEYSRVIILMIRNTVKVPSLGRMAKRWKEHGKKEDKKVKENLLTLMVLSVSAFGKTVNENTGLIKMEKSKEPANTLNLAPLLNLTQILK